jgi:predicted ATP-binding protein involved in virulence
LAFIEQYEKQKVKENILRQFVDKCNSYLNNKKLFYDDEKIKLIIKLDNGEQMDLSNLSSGEKQIISTLSKVYLNPDKKFIILFDEPELSLSITWQEKLLTDILESGNIFFLMAVTHSPFIVNNDLEEYANFIST